MGNSRDDDVAAHGKIGCSHPDGALPGLVHRADLVRRGDDLGLGRIVGAREDLHEIRRGRIGMIDELDAGRRDLARVVRRDVGRHADRDAGDAVEEYVREHRRQELRLVMRSVKVRHPVDRPHAELRKEHFGEGGERRLGVAHRGEGLRIVPGAPVALPLHEGIAAGEVLRHEDHRLIAGGVAVRMVVADYRAHGLRRLLGLGVRAHAELVHRVQDAALHGLEPVSDAGERAVLDDRHRIVEVGLLGE